MNQEQFDVSLELKRDQQFTVDFQQDGVAPLLMDEPPPVGQGQGPNAARMLAAAVGNCLSESALFCLRKARVPVRAMRTKVTATLQRNELKRLRVTALDVTIRVEVAEEDRPRMKRCLELFEDYCIVTQSVRKGIAVDVMVEPIHATTSSSEVVA